MVKTSKFSLVGNKMTVMKHKFLTKKDMIDVLFHFDKIVRYEGYQFKDLKYLNRKQLSSVFDCLTESYYWLGYDVKWVESMEEEVLVK